MGNSADRILTTHTGSLPRPASLACRSDPQAVRAAVAETVRRQREAGLDIINDGEASKPNYSTYVTERLSGFDGDPVPIQWPILAAADFPATRDIPPDRLRMHLCWGNDEGPHHTDIPLADIIDLVLAARPGFVSFEGANPRHEHEWTVFGDVKLPEGKVIIPGVLDSTTNFVEHPELVAQRLVRYADLVGRDSVIAGSDCGFATSADSATVDPRVAWAKLAAMAEGARLASDRLW